METRLGHCLFILFSEWIWLFITTSTLGGTKAEVRCIPSCQLPLVEALSREPSEPDLANDFGTAPAEEIVGFSEGPLDDATGIPASEQSSFKVEPRSEEDNASGPQRDAWSGRQKLSHPPRRGPRAPVPPLLANVTAGGRNDSFHAETGDVRVTGDGYAAGGTRPRSARSAETWSGFRSEGVDDAPVSDQEEFQLTSSTFALAGDTAHNQAMVHWSGQNSSVSGRVLCAVSGFYARTCFDAVWSALTHSHILCGI